VSFEFDPDKDAINIAKHGLSLADFEGFDAAPTIWLDNRIDYGEERYLAFGFVGGSPHCLVFTVRDENWRLISLRRAHRKELERYG
jgi:uncharacterized protein